MSSTHLIIAFINCKGQTGFNESKQLQIEHFLKSFDVDILHLQESHFDDSTFKNCPFLLSNYQCISNNSNSKYGTASIIKNSIEVARLHSFNIPVDINM